jgi:Asp/Glu/hydantoin racemase
MGNKGEAMPAYRGGRAIYGEAVGIMVLNTTFPRVPGDIGNASTFDFPVRIRVVPGATVQRIVQENDAAILPEFIEAAKELEAAGVRAITTSCGFLISFQEALSEAVRVPVFTSSLLQVPMVSRMLPRGKKVGILAMDSRRLTKSHLRSAGITDERIVVLGAEEDPEFYRAYESPQGALEIDPEKLEKAVVAMVQQLVKKNPDVGALVCEGINFAPYAAGVQEATGLPWFDIVDLTRLVYSAVVKKRYHGFL